MGDVGVGTSQTTKSRPEEEEDEYKCCECGVACEWPSYECDTCGQPVCEECAEPMGSGTGIVICQKCWGDEEESEPDPDDNPEVEDDPEEDDNPEVEDDPEEDDNPEVEDDPEEDDRDDIEGLVTRGLGQAEVSEAKRKAAQLQQMPTFATGTPTRFRDLLAHFQQGKEPTVGEQLEQELKELQDGDLNARKTPSGRSLLHGPYTSTCKVTVHFRNIRAALVRLARKYPVAMGCVAWFGSKEFSNALEGMDAVQVLLQKEDFLRRDMADKSRKYSNGTTHGEHARRVYASLPFNLKKAVWPLDLASALKGVPVERMTAVRCVGDLNKKREPGFPRMHHKFLVFCAYAEKNILVPKIVWTGSLNFSRASMNSLENITIIEDEEIAMGYLREWALLYSLSEPLDWTSEWMAPNHLR